jgi:hypothetical protein
MWEQSNAGSELDAVTSIFVSGIVGLAVALGMFLLSFLTLDIVLDDDSLLHNESWFNAGAHRAPFAAGAGSRRARESWGTAESSEEDELEAAYRVLGIDGAASLQEVRAAYRHLAMAYHPDKMRSVAPEFSDAANRKMAEINAGYETVMRRRFQPLRFQ